jgi:hypothetical protein
MSEVKVTKCPPGRALGAGDLQAWAHNRRLGRSGMVGQTKHDLEAWARNPNNVTSSGRALTPKEINKRRKAERTAKRKAEGLAKRKAERAERFKQRDIRRKLRTGALVLWGDQWPDDVSNNVTASVKKIDSRAPVTRPEPADPNERPPWE